MSKEEDMLLEGLEEYGLSAQAKLEFQKFMAAVRTEKGLQEACKNIYGILDELVLDPKNEEFKDTLPQNKLCYRARIIHAEDYKDKGVGTSEGKLLGFDEDNSREPMVGISSNGRNNINGESYLYLASNPETACMEVKPQFGDFISLATFKVSKELKIIDFSTDKRFCREESKIFNMSMGVFFTQLMFQYTKPVDNENDYRATQIISDYIRKTGIDGIAYRSFLVPKGVNYTIFNCHPKNIKFEDRTVLIHKQAVHSFWDLNEEKALFTNEEKNLVYNKEIANKNKETFIHSCKRK